MEKKDTTENYNFNTRKLEFDKILSLISVHCKSNEAKNILQNHEISTSYEAIKTELDCLEEIILYVSQNIFLPLFAIDSLNTILYKLKNGKFCEQEDCFFSYQYIVNLDNFIQFIAAKKYTVLLQYYSLSYSLKNIIAFFSKIFDTNGQILDTASDGLKKARADISRNEDKIRKLLGSLTKQHQDSLSSQNFILKDNKYFLPVVSGKQRSVNGIVYGFSDSGKTVFIEPYELISANNDLFEAKALEQHEIFLIIKNCNHYLKDIQDTLCESFKQLAQIDSLNAKAVFSFENKWNRADFDESAILLYDFYHPLLQNPVKNTIKIEKNKRFVVITGPNTGGKTVTLKSIGVIHLLFQSGMYIPAASGSKIPIFEKILVDIGDEQSIEKSLSTFSSHINTIKSILEKTDSKSLVLIDEIGTGTSPEEGEALACAILEELVEKGSWGLVSSHYNKIKLYAMKSENISNASMLFDEKSLLPLYVLRQNIPGSSYAFFIAKKLGIDDHIIQKAVDMAKESAKTDFLIKSINDLITEYTDKLKILNNRTLELEKQQEILETEQKKVRKTKNEIRDELKTTVEEDLKNLRKSLEIGLHDIKSIGYTKESSKNIQHLFEEKQETLSKILEKETTQENIPVKEYKIGQKIQIPSLNKTGIIKEIKGNKYKISVDAIQFEFTASDLMEFDDKENSMYAFTLSIANKAVSNTLDIRGYTVYDAKDDLDAYFDDLNFTNYESVYIIHGKGSGKLSEFVHEYLSHKKNVISYNFALPEEGGAGCTIVHLKH